MAERDDLETCTRCEAQTDNPTATWPRLLGVPREILCPTCAADLEPEPPDFDTREEYLASRGRD
ncbi:MAG TPA: hypothetical protein VLV48_07395 [Thermoanaerobaculia bacterium]|nr:hypothetical protein [Thermoanaerobaculia bacterium]